MDIKANITMSKFNETIVETRILKSKTYKGSVKELYDLDDVPSERVCKKEYDWGNYATVGTLLSWRILGE